MTETTSMPEGGPLPGRSCGSCMLCCKLLAIAELNKPEGTWCKHAKPGQGCSIYADRPGECRKFHCGYLSSELSEEWHPVKSKIVLSANSAGGITAIVDPGRPDAWREAPFYLQLKAWAGELLPQQRYVVVRIAKRAIAVLPDHDWDLGVMEPHEPIVMEVAVAPDGSKIYRARRAGTGHAARASAKPTPA